MSAEILVTLQDELLAKAEEHARSLGISVTEYVQSLVTDEIEHLGDPWSQPLPWEAEKQYLLEEIRFYEAEEVSPQKAAHSAEELVRLLDEEIQQIELIVGDHALRGR